MERTSGRQRLVVALPTRLVPSDAAFSVGTDRKKAIAGPDRIVTEASLFRKDFHGREQSAISPADCNRARRI